jgi:hypothetical protein
MEPEGSLPCSQQPTKYEVLPPPPPNVTTALKTILQQFQHFSLG